MERHTATRQNGSSSSFVYRSDRGTCRGGVGSWCLRVLLLRRLVAIHSALVRRDGCVLCLDWRNAGSAASTLVNRHALVAVALPVAHMLTGAATDASKAQYLLDQGARSRIKALRRQRRRTKAGSLPYAHGRSTGTSRYGASRRCPRSPRGAFGGDVS